MLPLLSLVLPKVLSAVREVLCSVVALSMFEDSFDLEDVVFFCFEMKGFLEWRFRVCWFQHVDVESWVDFCVGWKVECKCNWSLLVENQKRSDLDVVEPFVGSLGAEILREQINFIPLL